MVRTRFAPSPTGYMHIGNLRTALYEYLLAKANDGKFILRIEDTDRDRFMEESIDIIYKTLDIAGINPDEGPIIGGDYGPYIQSERKGLYLKFARELVEKGEAYYCFCSKERIEKLKDCKDKIAKYDRHCLNLTESEIARKLEENTPYVIRQKIKEGSTVFFDEVYGEIKVKNEEIEDQILIKSDGFPTYNFANVIDDYLMGITHIIRGSEYLSSTPKYNLLYKAFDWNIPTYIHVPPVMKNQTEKLSKRNGDASFQDLLDKGYLPEAIVNYIALLGWSPSTNQEIFSIKELIKCFNIKGLSKSPAIFDIDKLSWINGEYIKNMDFNAFFDIVKPNLEKILTNSNIQLKKVAFYIKSRINRIDYMEIEKLVAFLQTIPDYSTDLYNHKKMKTNIENSLETLRNILPIFENIEKWNNEDIYNNIIKLAAEMNVKNSVVLWPIRTALSGQSSSPCGASEIAELIGKEETINRIKIGINKLCNL